MFDHRFVQVLHFFDITANTEAQIEALVLIKCVSCLPTTDQSCPICAICLASMRPP